MSYKDELQEPEIGKTMPYNIDEIKNAKETPLFTSIRNLCEKDLTKIKNIFIEKDDNNKLCFNKNNIEKLYKVMEQYRDKRYETLRLVFISNKSGEIKEQIAVTQKNPSAVNFPIDNNYLINYCNSNDYKFFVCHNHPSGDPTPSTDDENMTKYLESNISPYFMGHIILDHETFSYKAAEKKSWEIGKCENNNEEDFLIKKTNDGVLNYHLKNFNEGTIPELANLLNDKDFYAGRFFPVVFTNKFDIRGIQFFSDVFFLSQDKDAIKKRLLESAAKCGGQHCFVTMPFDYSENLSEEKKELFKKSFEEEIKAGCFTDAGIDGKSILFSSNIEKPESFIKNPSFSLPKDFESTFAVEFAHEPAANLQYAKEEFKKSLAKILISDEKLRKNATLALIFNGLTESEIHDCWEVLTDIAQYKREQKKQNNQIKERDNENIHTCRRTR